MSIITGRRRLTAAVGIVLLGAAVAAVLSGSVLAAQQGTRTLRFRESSTNGSFVDVGPSGTSQGDYLAWDDPLTYSDSNTPAGRVAGVCTLVDVTSQLYDCAPVTYILPGGTIAVEGLFSGAGTPETDPIIGGTGVYRDVRGTDTVTALDATTTDHLLKLDG